MIADSKMLMKQKNKIYILLLIVLTTSCTRQYQKPKIIHLEGLQKNLEIVLPDDLDTIYSWSTGMYRQCNLDNIIQVSSKDNTIVMNTPKAYPVRVDSFNRFTIFYDNNDKKNCKTDISMEDDIFLDISEGFLFDNRIVKKTDTAVFFTNDLVKIDGLFYAIYYGTAISYNQKNREDKTYVVVASTILPTADWITLEFECFGGVNCDSTFFESSIAALKTVVIRDSKISQ